jgi:hypothetical protein
VAVPTIRGMLDWPARQAVLFGLARLGFQLLLCRPLICSRRRPSIGPFAPMDGIAVACRSMVVTTIVR